MNKMVQSMKKILDIYETNMWDMSDTDNLFDDDDDRWLKTED